MSGFSVSVDDSRLNRRLAKLSARVANPREAMEAIGQYVVGLVDLSFRDEQSPWNDGWQELSKATLRQRRGSSAQILSDTKRLANSINYRASDDSVTVGTDDVEYAATHQFGRGGVPARPYMPIDPETGDFRGDSDTIDDILDIVDSYIRGA
jgi:phage virion morphogenesis protein